MGFDDSQQAERDAEAFLQSDLLPQEETALMELQLMVDSSRRSDVNTSLLAVQPGPQSFLGGSQRIPQPIELKRATRSDADLSSGTLASGESEGSTEDTTRHLPDDREKIRLKRALIIVGAIAIVLFITVVVLQWPLWLSGLLRHY